MYLAYPSPEKFSEFKYLKQSRTWRTTVVVGRAVSVVVVVATISARERD